jgi:hypothetical protein
MVWFEVPRLYDEKWIVVGRYGGPLFRGRLSVLKTMNRQITPGPYMDLGRGWVPAL